MDLGLNESQEMLRQSARDFMTNECPKSLVRELRPTAENYSPAMWKKMADLGWMGLIIPEEYGGSGGNFVDLTVLLEEMGRAVCPSPYVSTTLCAMAINEAGNPAQKKELLPRFSSGEMIGSFALTEPSAIFTPDGINVTAADSGDSYVINGTKLFVRDANIANCMIVVARTSQGSKPEDGITLLIVDPRSSGIRINPLDTIGKDRQNEVVFDNVKVAKSSVLGEAERGWSTVEKLMEWGALAECAEMVGVGQQVFDWTVAYAKQRVQFGRPIGSFQAIQHKCADMWTDVDGCRYVTYYAAWVVSQGLPTAPREISRAKAFVGDALRRITREGQQIHAGLGFVVDHDLHMYFEKQKVAEMAYGDADFHRKVVAAKLLD